MTHLELLTLLDQGVEHWNQWRIRHRQVTVDFRGAQLDHRDLKGIDLSNGNFGGVTFCNSILDYAHLDGGRFYQTDFSSSSLSHARIRDAVFGNAALQTTQASGTDFTGSLFYNCDFTDARLDGSVLWSVMFNDCRFTRTRFAEASNGDTRYYCSDISDATDLHSVEHHAPSTIDVETLRLSRGSIPRDFLKGCGFSDFELAIVQLWNPELKEADITDIVYDIDRVRGTQPIQKHSVFLSYSHHDRAFVDALQTELDDAGIRCWRDVHDLSAGRLDKQIDRAIRLNPIVILVLSEHSVRSDWVEWEVSRARELERESQRDVLCPVALDDSWQTSSWSAPLRAQISKYNVLNFDDWRDQPTLESLSWRLVRGLHLFYPKP